MFVRDAVSFKHGFLASISFDIVLEISIPPFCRLDPTYTFAACRYGTWEKVSVLFNSGA